MDLPGPDGRGTTERDDWILVEPGDQTLAGPGQDQSGNKQLGNAMGLSQASPT